MLCPTDEISIAVVNQSESSRGFKSLRSGGEQRNPLADAYSISAK